MKGIILSLAVLASVAAGGVGAYVYFEKGTEQVVEVVVPDVEVPLSKVMVQFEHEGRSKILMVDAVLLTQPDNKERVEHSLNLIKNHLVLELSEDAPTIFSQDNFQKSLQKYLSLFVQQEEGLDINGALITRVVVQ